VSRNRLRIPDALRSMADLAAKLGWTVTHTRSGHLRWRSPDGVTVFTPSTPSDHRSSKNSRAQLRRAGLKETP
jgi:predicted RNA binding protein YcfA (HicA-like mRNA interferase family)